jgi:hypothetical protein
LLVIVVAVLGGIGAVRFVIRRRLQAVDRADDYPTQPLGGTPPDGSRLPVAPASGQARSLDDTRVQNSTDIDSIAEAGGRHVEHLFGTPMQQFLRQNAEELAVPPVPDSPLPRIATTGFSGIDLDADTQRTLVEAADATRAWQAAQTYDNSARAAIAGRTLERRLGRTIAQALVADAIGAQPLSSTPAPVDPAGLDAYVQARYSATGTPTTHLAPTVTQSQLSQAFATFFRRYITDPDGVKRDMPGVYVGFEEFLDGHDPAMLQDLERVQLEVLSAGHKAYRQPEGLGRRRDHPSSPAP